MILRVKQLCKERGLLQKDLAAKLGVTDISLRATLKNNPTLSTLERVAAALGCSVTDLFERTESDPVSTANVFIAVVRKGGITSTFEDFKTLKEWVNKQP